MIETYNNELLNPTSDGKSIHVVKQVDERQNKHCCVSSVPLSSVRVQLLRWACPCNKYQN